MSQQCTATSRTTGEQCKRPANKGTNVCYFHGGSSPQVRKAAKKRQTEAIAKARAERVLRRRLGMRLDEHSADPAQILLDLVATKAAEVEWLDAKIQELEDDQDLFWGITKTKEGETAFGSTSEKTHEAAQHIIYQLLHKAQDQLAKYTSDALRAGIEERQTKIAERTAQQFSSILTQLLNRLELPARKRAAADRIVLELLSGDTK